MPLMVTPRCCCIRAANGRLLATCSRCRAREDPEFARRCDTDFNQKPKPPVRKRKKTHRKENKP